MTVRCSSSPDSTCYYCLQTRLCSGRLVVRGAAGSADQHCTYVHGRALPPSDLGAGVLRSTNPVAGTGSRATACAPWHGA